MNYGATFASKGQEHFLKEFDKILETYISFSVQKVSKKSEVLDGLMAKETSPAELTPENSREAEGYGEIGCGLLDDVGSKRRGI